MGCQCSISLYFLAALAAMLTIDRSGTASLALAAIGIHESGHIIAMYALGQRPKEINLKLGALSIKKDASMSFGGEMAIMSAGVACNILVAAICFFLLFCVSQSYSLLLLCLVNFATALINIMPVRGLDGGTLLYLLTSHRFGNKAAEMVTFISSAAFIIIIVLPLAYYSVRNTFNPTMLCFALYLVVLMVIKSHK